MKEINVATIEETVSKMTVAQMRVRAKELGIKNAKKYKRAELSEMVVEAMVAVEQAKVTVAKKPSSQKSTNRAARGSNKNTDADVAEVERFLAACHNTSGDSITSVLVAYGRTVLIRVMADRKIKGWYRIYDKRTMIEKIVEQVGAISVKPCAR